MAIQKFSKEAFEQALPKDGSGQPLWTGHGAVSGEFLYSLAPSDEVRIMVRSSVRPNGWSADSGKDSIRAWLSATDGTPLGSKTQAYVNRQIGWERRLTEMLRKLWAMASKIERCDRCGKLMGVFKQKKAGPNKGREFTKCLSCGNGFRWTDQPKATAEQKVEERTPCAHRVQVLRLLEECETVKARTEVLKHQMKNHDEFAVWALMEVYDAQTADEQAMQATRYLNGVGFDAYNAPFLSSLAQQFASKGRLSDKQLGILKERIVNFATQLERAMRR